MLVAEKVTGRIGRPVMPDAADDVASIRMHQSMVS